MTTPSWWSLAICLCLLLMILGADASRAPTHDASDPARNVRYRSKTSAHLEPVVNFRVGGRHQLQSLSSFQPFTNDNGHIHVLPDQVKLEFTVFGEDHSYDVDIIKNLYAPGTMATVHREGGIVEQVPYELRAYNKLMTNGWISAVFRDDGIALITINRDGNLLTIDPLWEHERYLQSSTYASLQDAAPHGMVAHRSEDHIWDGDNLQQCDDKIVPGRDTAHRVHTNNTLDLRHGVGRQLLTVAPWTDCFTPFVAKKLSDGVAADLGFYKASGGTVAATQAAIASIWSSMNNVYLTQLNVWHEITETIIMSAAGTYAWNQDRVTTACPTINALLDTFTAWRSANRKTTQGLWEHLTDCFPPAGTVGLGWIGVLCDVGHGTSLSSKTSLTWTVVAHEMGHNFGAQHTFQLGQGLTGGIMDYGDGKLNGEYQFNTVYSKTEMCAEIVASMSTSSRTGMIPLAACWSSYAPSCGNSVVEPGEECDDGGASGCCDMTTCRLAAGAQCTNGGCCASCKYLPTSTTCSGSSSNSGYCLNGACTDSFCGYYGMPFCGTQSANPCKQQCTVSGACNTMAGYTDSSTGQPLPVNIADGAVCKQSPYSLCSAGSCVATASTVTYAWSSGTYSACSVTCGTGTQSRTVVCKDNSQNVVANSFCASAGTMPVTSTTCSGPVCMTYSWIAGGFGACTNDCGGGTQTQGVNCQNSATPPVIVLDSNCAAGTKPATSRTCSTQACPLQWSYSAFTSCPVTCGGGTITRTATCNQVKNGGTTVVASSLCVSSLGTSAATSQACATQACSTYDWSAANWAACSKACGAGTQTRAVVCKDSTGATASSASLCTTQAPISTQACNTLPCPVYHWTFGAWAPCSRTCGSGTTTRNVFCVDNSTNVDVTVADNFCTKTKPDQTSVCMTQNCADYHWWSTEWSACSKTCGSGTKTRQVYCHDMNIQPMIPADAVAAQNCIDKQLVILDSISTCNEQSCPVYVWAAGDWSSCTKSCGSGVHTRTVACILQGSTTVMADTNCVAATRPSSTEVCNSGTCGTYTWSSSAWSSCSVSCGGGSRTRSNTCVDQSGVTQSNIALCTGTPPVTTDTCATAACPVYWSTGIWSECSKKCEGGSMTRTVTCRNQATDAAVASSLCLSSQPSTTSDCNVQHCPQWYPQDWNACNLRCGDGFQNRTILCQDYLMRVVAPEECVHNVPASVQPCSIIPCPHWHIQAWGTCSALCNGGTQDRLVECRMPHDDPAYLGRLQSDITLCPPDELKPPSRQVCNIDACTRYYWNVGTWSTCSKTCGGGTQSTTVTCMDSSVTPNTAVASNLCIGAAQPSTQACNTQGCPAYEWYLQNGATWGTCSATCGVGVQKRSVVCRNTAATAVATYEIVADSFCASLPAVPATQSCVAPSCGNRGVCLADNTCYCRFGFKGALCEIWPFFSGLTTDASSFTAGVPGGETLPLKWYSGGNMPYVSLLLDRPSWTFPKYIARSIPNGGVYLWTVPSTLPAGTDYSIITWFSPQIYNRSATFSIADPCGYTSCGTQGTCVSGKCVCSAGYTGVGCTLSPCAAAQCNTLRSTCDAATGVCNCTSGYTGTRCLTPPSCTATCNNGYRSETLLGACGTCVCNNYWSGAACDTCALKCENGFTADATCSSCNCGVATGFYGDRCQCRYLQASIKLSVSDAVWATVDMTTDGNLWRFNDTFANDLAAAVTGTSAAMFSVQSVTSVGGGVLIKFYIMQNCPKVSVRWQSRDMINMMNMMDTSVASIDLDWSVRTRRLLQAASTDTSLTGAPLPPNITTSLRSQKMDTDSGLSKGVATSHADMSTLSMSDDPTSESTTLGLTAGVWVAILIGVVVFLSAVIAGACWYRSKKAKKLNDMLDRSAVEFSGGATNSTTSAATSPKAAPAVPSRVVTAAVVTPSRAAPAAPVKKPAPVAPRQTGALPPNWAMQKTDEGHPYWFNSVTGESTWTKPTA